MPKKAAEKSQDGASVFCRMTAAERELIERACQKKEEADPGSTFNIGKVMVVQAVLWARAVLGEK